MRFSRVAMAVGAAHVIAVAGSTIYLWLQGRGGDLSLRPDDQAYVAQGEVLYQEICASCHGANLEGQPNWRDRGPDGLLPAPPHDAAGHTWHHPDEVLFNLTKFGVQPFAGPDYRSAMPAFEGKLTDDEILAVLSYIKSTWPAEIRRRQEAINQAGRQQDG